MISDDPGEDADGLEDEDLLESFLAPDAAGRDPAIAFEDWPPPGPRDYAAGVDPAIQEALKEEHPNWRSGIEEVLRGWAEARAQASVPTAPTAAEEPQSQA
jgi:hypothetical protein